MANKNGERLGTCWGNGCKTLGRKKLGMGFEQAEKNLGKGSEKVSNKLGKGWDKIGKRL